MPCSTLEGKGADADALSQAVYDAMFADLDGSLRELGVADLGVGRRIKTMTEALNGRIQAYDGAFATGTPALEQAIRRNVYGTMTPSDAQVRWTAGYLSGIRAVFVARLVRGFVHGPRTVAGARAARAERLKSALESMNATG